MVYFDNAATTGRKPEPVVQAVTAAMLELSVNAGRGSYDLARKATKLIDECKERILKLAGLRRGYHVFFSPSATISLNQLLLALPCDNYSSIYVTPFEHNAVMRTVEHIRHKSGCSLHVIPFDRNTWELQKEDLHSQFLRNKPEYLITSLVSNTTGYLLPVYEMTQLAHEFGAKVIVDCAQALGSVDVDYAQIGADAYVFAGHKTLYGPYGIAGTILADSWNISPGLFGGTGSDSLSLDMPSPENGGYEPGSPNTFAIAGLNAALIWIEQVGVQTIEQHEARIVEQIRFSLATNSRIKLYLPPADKQKGIVALNVKDYQSHDVGEILDDEFGIAVRTGYQCAPLVHDWLGSKAHGGIVRVSPSYFTTDEEVRHLLAAIDSL